MYKNLKDIPNPYNHREEVRNEKLFVGRRSELNTIKDSIEDYIGSGQRKNFLVLGDKSLGKSSFLYQVQHSFLERNFLASFYTLTENKVKTELHFFKELFDNIIVSGEQNDYLNIKTEYDNYTQYEIWESLTIFGEHASSKNERMLFLADVYANALRTQRFDIPLSESYILKDIEFLTTQAKKQEFTGLVIIIDEIQFLSYNDGILQLLLNVMQKTSNVIFVFCGNEKIKSESFEKLIRHTETIEILPFTKSEDLIDLLYKPPMYYGFTRDEINDELDKNSVSRLFARKSYNPYHFNLILYHMFEKYKNGQNEKIMLDADVSNEVITNLKNIASHHEKISAQLNSCTSEQLESFRRLFSYQNINLYDIALLQFSFESIKEEEFNKMLKNILVDLLSIKELGLFNIKLSTEKSLETLTENKVLPSEAADISYNFIGNNIDALYASYIVESSLGKELNLSVTKDFFDLMSKVFSEYLINKLKDLLCKNETEEVRAIWNVSIPEKPSELELTSASITDKLNQISTVSELNNRSSKDYESVNEALKTIDLFPVLHHSKMINHDSGFYHAFIKVKIRHRIVLYKLYIPYNNCSIDTFPFYPMDFFDSEILHEYKIEIQDSVILNIKPRLLLFVQSVDISDIYVHMLRNVYREEYDEAIKLIELMEPFQTTKDVTTNNIGFVYLVNNELIKAQKHFDKVKSKEFTTLINLAYLNYLEGNNQKAHRYVKESLKSLAKFKNEENKFVVIHQILISSSSRKSYPKYWDVVYEPSVNLILNGNLAILASFDNQNHALSLLNKAKNEFPYDEFYRKRYESWIYFNLKDYSNALLTSKTNRNSLPETPLKDYFLKIINFDISIQESM